MGIDALNIVGKFDQSGFNNCIIMEASAFFKEDGVCTIEYNCEGPKE
jgi:hypothetical protein